MKLEEMTQYYEVLMASGLFQWVGKSTLERGDSVEGFVIAFAVIFFVIAVLLAHLKRAAIPVMALSLTMVSYSYYLTQQIHLDDLSPEVADAAAGLNAYFNQDLPFEEGSTDRADLIALTSKAHATIKATKELQAKLSLLGYQSRGEALALVEALNSLDR